MFEQIFGWTVCPKRTEKIGKDIKKEENLGSELGLGMDVWVCPAERQITFVETKDADCNELEHALLDIIGPKLLAHDGELVLHAGAVLFHSSALAFMAPSGSGKSTLAASMHSAGYSLISDDAVIVSNSDGGVSVKRLYASLRLFPDSIANLYLGSVETSPVTQRTDKLRVSFDEGPESAPLRALFRLRESNSKVVVNRLPPVAACMVIIENSFAFDPKDINETRRRLAQAVELSKSTPVFDLIYPREYARLPEVHESIFNALDALQNLK